MIVAITGGRNFNRRMLLRNTLDDLHEKNDISLIVHGGARGADSLADDWAADRGIQRAKFPYLTKCGRAGGPRRNQSMLAVTQPHILLAFQGGTGTASCIERAELLNIPVRRVDWL